MKQFIKDNSGYYIFSVSLLLYTQLNWINIHEIFHSKEVGQRILFSVLIGLIAAAILKIISSKILLRIFKTNLNYHLAMLSYSLNFSYIIIVGYLFNIFFWIGLMMPFIVLYYKDNILYLYFDKKASSSNEKN